MLDEDDLANAEGDALALYSLARCDPDDPPGLPTLCRRLIGSQARRVRMVGEARCLPVAGRWRVEIHRMLPPERANFLIGHEVAEWWYSTRARHFGSLAQREAHCDALGAMLACPRPAFTRAVKTIGHRVHALARCFVVPQGLSLLRIGEVTGRPVAFVRRVPIVRGDAFVWPDGPGLRKAVTNPPASVHRVRADEQWGLMAMR